MVNCGFVNAVQKPDVLMSSAGRNDDTNNPKVGSVQRTAMTSAAIVAPRLLRRFFVRRNALPVGELVCGPIPCVVRASAEVALQLTPRPRMGERVSYYIMAKLPGKSSDWQRARALALYDPQTAPYDPDYYADKLEDWIVRYGTFLGVKPLGDNQGELFGEM